MTSLLSVIRATWLELFHGYHAWQGQTGMSYITIDDLEGMGGIPTPVPVGAIVDIITRDGRSFKHVQVVGGLNLWDNPAHKAYWLDDGLGCDITWWRPS